MKQIKNINILRFITLLLIVAVSAGYSIATWYSMTTAYSLAHEQALEQAAKAHTVLYQAIKRIKGNDLGFEVFREVQREYDAENLSEYYFYIYSFDDNGDPNVESSISPSFGKTNLGAQAAQLSDGKEEKSQNDRVEKALKKHYEKNSKKEWDDVFMEFTPGELKELNKWSKYLFTPEKHYKLHQIRILVDGKYESTDQYAAITRSIKLLNDSEVKFQKVFIKIFILTATTLMITLLLLVYLIVRINRQRQTEQKLTIQRESQKQILKTVQRGEEAWRQFNHDVEHPLRSIQQNSAQISNKTDDALIIKKASDISDTCSIIKTQLDELRVSVRDGEAREGLRVTEYVSIKELLYEVLYNAEMRRLIRVAGLKKFNVVIEDTDIKTRLDRGNIMKAIQNLIKNAIRFTPKGGMIQIFVTVQNDSVVLKILDDGRGIDPHVEKSFLELSDESPLTNEFGNGLVIVKKIMEAHNGELIMPRNRPDQQGTEVTLKLPLIKPKEE